MRKAFICPTRFVQGENELLNLGYFVKGFGSSALLIAHPGDVQRVREQLDQTAERFGVTFVESNFGGECSRQEVARLQEVARANGCACTIGLGGGKAIDTAKCVAQGDALIIVPTIAATDAPTSHSAVLYTPDGAFDDYAYFKQSPSVILIDTTVGAPATSRACANVNAGLPCGARDGSCPKAKGTNAAMALAKLCYETLLEDGVKAKLASDCNMVTPALENIIEANILLSGLGFESGGLAAAHAIHDGLTILPGTHHYFHGEKVAFGTLAQLVLENAPTQELEEVLDFCLAVGLPVCLADIGVDSITDEELMQVAEKSCIPEESVHSMPFPVTPGMVAAAIIAADKLGSAYKLERA